MNARDLLNHPGAATRHLTTRVRVGEIIIGGGAPVVVQSMTNTATEDLEATYRQVRELAAAGSELVRVTVNTPAAAAQIAPLRERLDRAGCSVPLIGDFHFNGHKLLQQFPDCAAALAKYRINPGNVGKGAKRDEQFAIMIEMACRYEKPVRIGVNWGSLDQDLLARQMDANARRTAPLTPEAVMREALIASALQSAAMAERLGLPSERIVLSCKVSEVQDLIVVYRVLAQQCHYALHLGLTEAGMGSKGIVASAAALAVLLQEGIGDTIRVSLTPEPNGERGREVLVAQEILQALGIRSFAPMVTACPGCGRTSSTTFQTLAASVQAWLRAQMPVWRGRFTGVENLRVAVMGCVVNGPGESRLADVGISLPGSGEVPIAPVYVDGQKAAVLKGERIVEEFQEIVTHYVERRYGAPSNHPSQKEPY